LISSWTPLHPDTLPSHGIALIEQTPEKRECHPIKLDVDSAQLQNQ